MLAPVVIFVYARPEHTEQTIEALEKNYLAKDTDIYIYSDAPKNEKAIDKVKLVRDYIESLPDRNVFRSVSIIKAEKNKGLAASVISGVSEIIKKHGKVIVVEDDLISSKDFLKYMNDALNYYEKDNKIWSISGYTFNLDIPKDYKNEVYLSYRGCSWGWATWQDRWGRVDWDVSDYNSFKSNKESRKKFNRGGRDMAYMLDAQMKGEIDSWAIRWCYSQSKLDMLTVYPVTSKIRNIGLDGTGTHSGVNPKFSVLLEEKSSRCKLDKPQLDSRIVKSFQDKFGTKVEYLIFDFRKFVKKLLGM